MELTWSNITSLILFHFFYGKQTISFRDSDIEIIISSNVFYAAIALNYASNVAIAPINVNKCRYVEKKINMGFRNEDQMVDEKN